MACESYLDTENVEMVSNGRQEDLEWTMITANSILQSGHRARSGESVQSIMSHFLSSHISGQADCMRHS